MALETPNLTMPADAVSAAPAAHDDDPLWYKDAIIYQAHVKSFFDSNNDGVGDFQGLTQKLDYLQGLGVTCIWLLPFYPSPLRDDGYDIADYRSVHPSYGTLADFTAFVRAAHDRRMQVLIELVVNHTSDQHPWFQRARHAPPGSPERAFYVWSDTDTKFPETRIIFTDTEPSNWSFDPVARQYYWHRFFSHQPDLNHNNPAVVDAVIAVMEFWLDLGVDALRLDAVPYLCVREGTTNENLPETHAVLKRIRHELDARYANRMLLAEANQWPADVRAYFGEGDECHMAFHFPLMPRMFMALRQEDRHAITEILNQTPDIPDSCQWALFLRNHDELTLEMVTDEERDYMYSVYAADPQARINVGIRRRLAPLVENSRRRIELLNALLFSMPGTPIVYYGDEIGMGDNIYLGDRNGVRTPMQWSSDRNGGFSRADPARLFAPPVQDPVYGFQAINVEAEERHPFSLLHYMKRLIATRRQHRVFGRGSLEFVGCANRKVLAYVRRDDRETVLVVANLSRALQPAPLDLQAFAGLVPIEMVGLSEFPRIGDQPYFLTLGPYAVYWFELAQESARMTPRAIAAADSSATIRDGLPALLMGTDWKNVLDSGTRTVLEKQALAPFLQRQRWFAAKSREIRRVSFSDWAPLRKGAEPSFLAIVAVEYADGWSDAYFMPLALVTGEQADRALHDSVEGVIARITGARKGAIVDAAFDDDSCDRMLALTGHGDQIASARGSVQGVAIGNSLSGSALRGAPSAIRDPQSALRWSRGSGDQSNTVIVAGDRHVLKLFRRIEPGTNPEYELGRHLTDHGFTRVPPLEGALEYHRAGLEAGTLAIVQTLVRHQGSGWEFALDELRRYYERVSARALPALPAVPALPAPPAPPARPAPPALPARPALPTLESPPPFFAALERWYLSSATMLGRRTGELHLTLADSRDAAFAPEPLDDHALDALATRMHADAERSLNLLAQRLTSLSGITAAQAEAVIEQRTALLSHFDAVRRLANGGQRIRVHGDYHLGQVLRTEEDFVIIDFEGEPARSIDERCEKHSPLKDIAGMVRSFSYAAYAGLFAFTTHAPDRFSALERWADGWQYWAAHAFITGYTDATAETAFLPRGAAWTTLLRAFVLDKALYELGYELNHRPEWVRIPLAGIQKLIGDSA